MHNEILVCDTDSQVRAHLDRTNDIRRSLDPRIAQSLASDSYMETYRENDLAPGRGEPYLARTVRTKGSQFFFGLTWYGHVLKRVTTAFANGTNGPGLSETAIQRDAVFSARLVKVEEASENVLSDLELVVQTPAVLRCAGPTATGSGRRSRRAASRSGPGNRRGGRSRD